MNLAPHRGSPRVRKRHGSALLMLVAMLVATLAVASYVINVEYMEFTRTELQITTDLSVRAACRKLADTGNELDARNAAQLLANKNPVAGQKLTYAYDDLQFSVATRTSVLDGYSYSSRKNPNAVRLAPSFFQRSEKGLKMRFPTLGVPVNFRPIKAGTAIQSDVDLAIVVDCSTSMTSPGDQATESELPAKATSLLLGIAPTSRWSLAEQGISAILGKMEESPPDEFIGLCAFSNLIQINSPLSNDCSSLRLALFLLQSKYVGGNTNLAEGMQQGLMLLFDKKRARPWASRVLLVISDGKVDSGANPLTIGQSAANAHVLVYTISLANEADQKLLSSIAAIGHGQHVHARSVSDFVNLFDSIVDELPILIAE